MILYLVLSVATLVYGILSAMQDLKERMIYSFPCYVLTIFWGIYIWRMHQMSPVYLICFWVIHIVIYLCMNHFKIWGGGDSDFLFLFANVFLAIIGKGNVSAMAFMECMCLIVALSNSTWIGYLEGKVKKKKINLNSEVAVVPGFVVVMALLLMAGYFGRYQML
ncbi:MAG: hypothetical protein PHW47_08025 [Lachnospira sp.]|nr:hypothetical protein [Lachnospira sp.]